MKTPEPSRMGTSAKPFDPATANQPVAQDQASVFRKAAGLIDGEMHLTQAIFAAGGTRQHVNQFSRSQCGGAPIDPWCTRDMRTVDDVVEALETVACQVEKGEGL